jgi:uncharacterized membrane protein
MSKTRLEAFSDAVIAIIITIMVLELRPPHVEGDDWWGGLWDLRLVFLSYLLSFVNLGIYWNNHHHLFQAAKVVDGSVLWANLLLLFWLSLFPFATTWMGESEFAAVPTGVYGILMVLAAVAYSILVWALRRCPGQADTMHAASGTDRKGMLSIALYAVGVVVALALGLPLVAVALYVVVAAIWFIPDRHVEQALRG